MEEVSFSPAQLATLAAVFGPLLTAIGVLFRALIASKNEQITASADALDEALQSNKALAAAVAEATRELRELRQDLWREKRIADREREP